ncbi:type II toxin-antitoxin system HicA family toxin [Candidatus Micrarchaeota archaeon]|nr:type II toxin-antitoxin system HicA family toxin [Candidatus Micrarchaeota archaeon]
MMLPHPPGKKIIKLLSKEGFEIVGRKGSHIRLKKKNKKTKIVIVPDHKELAPGTLLNIIRRSKIPKERFLRLLKKI